MWGIADIVKSEKLPAANLLPQCIQQVTYPASSCSSVIAGAQTRVIIYKDLLLQLTTSPQIKGIIVASLSTNTVQRPPIQSPL